ncbi:MAG: YraN family protein [Clostridia bacterium]|nr:YraN family protein [Clostridia bacterium]
MGITQLIGNYGEEKACALLKKKKYRILARNYACRLGELDIVAAKDEFVVFVEVKARSAETHGCPREFVTPKKQQRVLKAAQHFLLHYGLEDRQPRFDVIEVYLNDKKHMVAIKHLENAF